MADANPSTTQAPAAAPKTPTKPAAPVVPVAKAVPVSHKSDNFTVTTY